MEEFKVLIVDDDREIVNVITNMLKEEKFIIYTANDGEKALDIVTCNILHLVIMDVMMPKLNGIMATIKIREKQNVPILMLSAKTEATDKVIGLSAGADDYLAKPFFKDELIARVNALLRRYTKLGSISDKNSKDVINYFDLLLDTDKKKLLVRDVEAKLTATEYKIVNLLLSRPGKVFSAEEIYERVWECDAFAVENTVMIHISRLREKIEINPKKPEYIKVVWGIGYKIEKE